CTLSLLLSGAAILWCALFSGPASIRKFVDHGIAIANTAYTRGEELEAKFLQHKLETEAIREGIEGVLESVEKKRRQTSAAASRLQLSAEPEPTTRDEIVQAARQRVFGGAG
ncbi:unnamed protein product, partial [marine sediment metagenome]